jgi:hypothetical protein
MAEGRSDEGAEEGGTRSPCLPHVTFSARELTEQLLLYLRGHEPSMNHLAIQFHRVRLILVIYWGKTNLEIDTGKQSTRSSLLKIII